MFDLVYDGIKGILQGQGYAESTEAVDFVNASANEYENTFILKTNKGEIDEKSIINTLYDRQTWEIQIAFGKNANADIVNRNQAHRAKDTLLVKLDNPDNWSSFVEIIKYKSWELREFPNYFVLSIMLEIIDKYTY